jgi:hypothetical protein
MYNILQIFNMLLCLLVLARVSACRGAVRFMVVFIRVSMAVRCYFWRGFLSAWVRGFLGYGCAVVVRAFVGFWLSA